MPEQVKDVDALGGSGGGDAGRDASEAQIGMAAQDPDFPPDSIIVTVSSGRDPFWADAVASAVYERDDSTKGSTNPKAQAQQHASQHSAKPRSNSQRYSGSLQPSHPIIGIPGKIQQHSGYLGRSGRRPTDSRIFPKKSSRADADADPAGGGGGRKSAVPDEEPGSPKVSCIGKVLSEREQDRCRRKCRRLQEGKEERVEPAGCWASLAEVLCCAGDGGDRVTGPGDASPETNPSAAPAKPAAERIVSEEPATKPPALGAMRRFQSGRRTVLWDEDEDGDGDVGLEEAERENGRRTAPPFDDGKVYTM